MSSHTTNLQVLALTSANWTNYINDSYYTFEDYGWAADDSSGTATLLVAYDPNGWTNNTLNNENLYVLMDLGGTLYATGDALSTLASDTDVSGAAVALETATVNPDMAVGNFPIYDFSADDIATGSAAGKYVMTFVKEISGVATYQFTPIQVNSTGDKFLPVASGVTYEKATDSSDGAYTGMGLVDLESGVGSLEPVASTHSMSPHGVGTKIAYLYVKDVQNGGEFLGWTNETGTTKTLAIDPDPYQFKVYEVESGKLGPEIVGVTGPLTEPLPQKLFVEAGVPIGSDGNWMSGFSVNTGSFAAAETSVSAKLIMSNGTDTVNLTASGTLYTGESVAHLMLSGMAPNGVNDIMAEVTVGSNAPVYYGLTSDDKGTPSDFSDDVWVVDSTAPTSSDFTGFGGGGGGGGGGGNVTPATPTLVIDGDAEPGGTFFVHMSDGSMLTSVQVQLWQDGVQMSSLYAMHGEYYLDKDAQGMTIKVSAVDSGSQTVTLTQVVPEVPAVHGHSAGADEGVGQNGLPTITITEFGSSAYLVAPRDYDAYWDTHSTSVPQLTDIELVYGWGAAGYATEADAIAAAAGGLVEFRVDTGSAAPIYVAATYNSTEMWFEATIDELDIPIGPDGYQNDVTYQLVVNDQLFGEAGQATYRFDHTAPTGSISRIDDADVGGLAGLDFTVGGGQISVNNLGHIHGGEVVRAVVTDGTHTYSGSVTLNQGDTSRTIGFNNLSDGTNPLSGISAASGDQWDVLVFVDDFGQSYLDSHEPWLTKTLTVEGNPVGNNMNGAQFEASLGSDANFGYTLPMDGILSDLLSAGSAHQLHFSEPVHFSAVFGAPSVDTWTVPSLTSIQESLVSSPTGSEITGVWLHVPMGDEGYGEWINLHNNDYPPGTPLSGWRFDGVILTTADSDAEFAFNRPLNVQSVTAGTPDTTTDPTVYSQSFTVDGIGGNGFRGLEGMVQDLDVNYFMVDVSGTPTAFLTGATITWENIVRNDLNSEVSATLTFEATKGTALSVDEIAALTLAVNVGSITQTIIDITSTGLSDDAGNLFDGDRRDPTVYLDTTSASDVFYKPATGTGGSDLLDVTALGGGLYVDSALGLVVDGTKQYLIADFTRIGMDGEGSFFEGGDASYHAVSMSGTGGNNELAGGASTLDWVSFEDIDVTGGNGITVNLSGATGTAPSGDTRDWISVGLPTAGTTDYIVGFEHLTGSSADDTITGTAGFEILEGAGGGDTITGDGSGSATGGDLLVGGGSGSGTDTLIGTSGFSDILVDLDGAVMEGRTTAWATTDGQQDSDHDVFVVRDAATINNFALSTDQAHLSGRSQLAADRITFALDTAAVISAALAVYPLTGHPVDPLSADFEYTDEIKANVMKWVKDDLSVVSTDDGTDLTLTLTDGTATWGSAVLTGVASTLGTSFDAQVVRLDKYESSRFDLVGYAAEELSSTEDTAQEQAAAERLIRNFLENNLLSGSEIHIPIALEAVEAGTIGDSTPGKVLAAAAGLLDSEDRLFVPGYGDQDLLGGRGSDRYKFVVQDFTEEAGVAGDAGRDTVIDIGGVDDVYLGAALINDLHIEAFRAGREQSSNSLRIDYEQTTTLDGGGTLINNGSIEWLGAFRDGGRTALETITVGADTNTDGVADTDVTYSLAQADYDVTGFTYTPTGGGGAYSADAGRSFVVDASSSGEWIVAGDRGETDYVRITGTHDHGPGEVRIWGFDTATDVIDITAWLSANSISEAGLSYTRDSGNDAITLFDQATGGLELATIYFMDWDGPEQLDQVMLITTS